MNNIVKVLIAIALALFVGSLPLANAAVTTGPAVTEINSVTYNDLIAKNKPVSWIARFQAGGNSGEESYEFSAQTNIVPQQTRDHVWSYPEKIGVYYGYDGSKLNVYAGSDHVDVTPTVPFNTLLFRVLDGATTFGSVSFNGGTIVMNDHVTNISDIYVNEASKYFRIDLGQTNPKVNIEGMFSAIKSNLDKGRVEFTGLYVLPEPTSPFLFFFAIAFFVFRRPS